MYKTLSHRAQNYDFFSKIYSQRILNRAKNIRSSTVKTVFESDVLLRNCREKREAIRVDARMQTCVSLCPDYREIFMQ